VLLFYYIPFSFYLLFHYSFCYVISLPGNLLITLFVVVTITLFSDLVVRHDTVRRR